MLSTPEMNKSLSRESILTGGAEGQRISIFLHPDESGQTRMMWQQQLDLFFLTTEVGLFSPYSHSLTKAVDVHLHISITFYSVSRLFCPKCLTVRDRIEPLCTYVDKILPHSHKLPPNSAEL